MRALPDKRSGGRLKERLSGAKVAPMHNPDTQTICQAKRLKSRCPVAESDGSDVKDQNAAQCVISDQRRTRPNPGTEFNRTTHQQIEAPSH
jgi:hypothetical protein